MRSLKDTWLIVATVLGTYFGLYALEFLYKLLFLAPPALDAQREAENKALSEQHLRESNGKDAAIAALEIRLAPKISIAGQKQRDLVTEKLSAFTDQEKEILEHLVIQGKQTQSQWLNRFGHIPWTGQTISKLIAADLVRRVPTHGQSHAFDINPALAEAIKYCLHGD